MIKRGSVIIESLLVFFVVICCFFIALPFMVNTNQTEKNMVRWAQHYSNIQYAFEILKVQLGDSDKDFMSSGFQNKLKEFVREKNRVSVEYRPKFLRTSKGDDRYVFEKFYETEKGLVIGFKWINPKCQNKEICAMMSVDLNGVKKPNVWGRDVFGVKFLRDEVLPIGYGLNLHELKRDCLSGSGVYCSAYYLIGGLFIK